MRDNYWTRRYTNGWLNGRPFSRRAALRGAGFGIAGVAGAGLVGCGGDDDDEEPSGSGGSPESGASPGATTGGGNGDSSGGNGGGGGTAAGNDKIPVVEGAPVPGGVYTTGATATYLQHDPHTALGPNIWHSLGEKAFELQPATGELMPSLVESHEIADDGLTITLTVRPGIAMHPGGPWESREFDAEDVAWNLMRIYGATAEEEGIPLASFQRRSLLEGMDRAEAIDAQTVSITMTKPNSSFLNAMAENRMVMMPREMVDIGFDNPLAMGGPGAFRIVEFESDVIMAFERFDNYFREGEPYFDRYENIVIPDRAAQVAAFIAGDTAAIGALQTHEITALEAAVPDALLYEWVDTNWMHFRPNMTYGPFTDFRVRKAFQLALDYAELGDGFWGSGWGYQAALHPAYPEAWSSDEVKALPGYNPDTKDADRAEATALLEAAGFPNGAGIEFEMLFVEQIPDTEENAIRFQDQMQGLFSDMKITTRGYPDLASFSRPQSEGEFQAVSYIITSVPDAVLEALGQFHSGGSRNYGAFENPDLDSILDRAQAELDMQARAQLLDEFQTRFMDEWLPLIVFYARPVRTMLRNNIGGYDKTAGSWFGYGGITEAHQWYFVD